MSVGASPPRSALRSLGQIVGMPAIARARRLVMTLGGRFSVELGIDVDGGADEVERWALAATLLGNRISADVAICTYRELERAGVQTIADAGERRAEELVALLDSGGYVGYDRRTARGLLMLADAVSAHYGRVAALGEQLTDADELERALRALPGWGAVTVHAFLRELRGVWRGANVPLDGRAAAAAGHLLLPVELDALRSVASRARLDVRDFEAGLIRLALAHDLAGCPGGEECPFAGSQRERLVE